MKKPYAVLCSLSEVEQWRRLYPDLDLKEVVLVAKSRNFLRWIRRNRKLLYGLAFITPTITLSLFNLSPEMLSTLFIPTHEAVPAFAVNNPPTPSVNFFSGNGVILLHMLIVGFVTLVITTFMKFTGRGDLAPLVAFVGGGVILYEVLGLFKSIYQEIATFLQM